MGDHGEGPRLASARRLRLGSSKHPNAAVANRKGGILKDTNARGGRVFASLALCCGLVLAPALASRVNRSADPRGLDVEAGPVNGDGGNSATGLGDGSDVPLVDAEITAAAVPTTIVEEEEEPSTTTTTHVHRSTTTTTAKRATAKASTTTTTKPKPTTTTTTTTKPKPTTTTTTAPDVREQRGLASWYEAAEPGYCAHRTLPKGTKVWVRAVADGKRVSCTVNDRGPYIDGRIIDLSREDFQQLTPDIHGIIEVVISW